MTKPRFDLAAQVKLLGADSLLPPAVLSRDEGRELLNKIDKRLRNRSKFNVGPASERTVDGIVFDSMREAARYGELKLLEKGGYISRLELQPVYPIEIDGTHICKVILDFRYFEGAQRVAEDTKGYDNALSRLKRKLVEAQYRIKVRVVK